MVLVCDQQGSKTVGDGSGGSAAIDIASSWVEFLPKKVQWNPTDGAVKCKSTRKYLLVERHLWDFITELASGAIGVVMKGSEICF